MPGRAIPTGPGAFRHILHKERTPLPHVQQQQPLPRASSVPPSANASASASANALPGGRGPGGDPRRSPPAAPPDPESGATLTTPLLLADSTIAASL